MWHKPWNWISHWQIWDWIFLGLEVFLISFKEISRRLIYTYIIICIYILYTLFPFWKVVVESHVCSWWWWWWWWWRVVLWDSSLGFFSGIPINQNLGFPCWLLHQVWVCQSWICEKIPPIAARWAPTSYKWSYKPYKWPYKWVTGVITLLIGVITPFITSRGPTLCVSLQRKRGVNKHLTPIFEGLRRR